VREVICAQEYFSSVGGLGTLCVSLASLVPHSSESLPACSMAITLTKTLAACITDNRKIHTHTHTHTHTPPNHPTHHRTHTNTHTHTNTIDKPSVSNLSCLLYWLG